MITLEKAELPYQEIFKISNTNEQLEGPGRDW